MHELVSQKSVTGLVGEELPDTFVLFCFVLGFPIRWCWPTKFPPYLDSSIYLCSPWAEHQNNIHELHDFLQNYARHKTTKPVKKNYEAMHKTTKPVCVIIHAAYRYIHTLYNVMLPCLLSLSLSSPAFSIWNPTHQKRRRRETNNSTC